MSTKAKWCIHHGMLFTIKEIETAAKNSGLTTDEYIEKYRIQTFKTKTEAQAAMK